MLYVITSDSASLGLYPSAVVACVHPNKNNNSKKQVFRVKKLVGRQGAPEPQTTC